MEEAECEEEGTGATRLEIVYADIKASMPLAKLTPFGQRQAALSKQRRMGLAHSASCIDERQCPSRR